MSTRALLVALSTLCLVVAGALLLGPLDARGAGSWVWPLEGTVLTEYHNGDDPYASGQHRGIDIAGAVGAPAAAAAGGTVRYRGVAGSSGLTVSIRTADGRFDTSYLHLASADVKKGQAVGAGERIGTVGTSGRRSAEAPHLHFGVREAGSRHAYLDPRSFLGPPPLPRATEPRGAPVPVRAPVPVLPAPAPVPVGSPSPVRIPGGGRVRVPAARRVRVPSARRVGRPLSARPAPGRVGVGGQAPASGAVPELGPLSAPEPGAAQSAGTRPATPVEIPALGPGPPAQPAQIPDVVTLQPDRVGPARAADPAAATPPGPDAGWAIACLGLLLAAACVGGRPGGRDEPRARRAAVRSLLKPLTGRR